MKEIKLFVTVRVDPDEYFGAVDEDWEDDFLEDIKQALTEMGGVQVTQLKKKG